MKSTLKILQDNIFTIIVIIVFIIGMFFLSYLKRVYWDNNNEAGYGDRVLNNKNYVIDDDRIKNIEESVNSKEGVISCEYDLEGRIINLTITLEDNVEVKNARKLGDELLSIFSEEELSYYSIQFYMLKNDEKLDDFPIIGYRHYSYDEEKGDHISWSKDREATKDESE